MVAALSTIVGDACAASRTRVSAGADTTIGARPEPASDKLNVLVDEALDRRADRHLGARAGHEEAGRQERRSRRHGDRADAAGLALVVERRRVRRIWRPLTVTDRTRAAKRPDLPHMPLLRTSVISPQLRPFAYGCDRLPIDRDARHDGAGSSGSAGRAQLLALGRQLFDKRSGTSVPVRSTALPVCRRRNRR